TRRSRSSLSSSKPSSPRRRAPPPNPSAAQRQEGSKTMAKSALDKVLAEATTAEVEVDFSAARDGDFAPITPGEYRAVVDEATAGTSKAGTPKVVLRFKIVEGEQHAGRLFFRHCPTRGDGSGILRDTLRALGFDVDSMTKFTPSDAVGREALITVGFQKGSDELQEIKKVKALPGAKPAAKGAKSRSRAKSRL